MRKRHGGRKRNNLGMSLVEIVIAMAIMAVAIGPVLRVIVYSMQMNARAREQQHLNTAAQSVMEGLKGYNIEDIYRQFNGEDTFKIHHDTAATAVVSPDPAAAPCVDAVTGEFKAAANNSYEFTMTDMNVDGNIYDARVVMKPMEDGAGSPVTWTIADTEDINPYTDAVFRQEASQDVDALGQLQEGIVALLTAEMKKRVYDPLLVFNKYVEPTVLNLDMSKITIEKDMKVFMWNDKVTIEWKYTFKVDKEYKLERKDGIEEKLGELPVPLEGDYDISTQQIYSNSGTSGDGASLKNVYLFYYPAYENVTGVYKDNIHLINYTGGEVNVFLLKQRLPGYSDTSIQIMEGSYHGSTSGVKVSGNNNSIILYHNLDRNLINGSTYYPSISGPTEAKSLSVDRTASPLLEDEQKVLLYDVLVEIHEAGTDFGEEPLLTLQGSVNSK